MFSICHGTFGGGFRKPRPHHCKREINHRAFSVEKAQEEHLNLGGAVGTPPRQPMRNHISIFFTNKEGAMKAPSLFVGKKRDMRLRSLDSMVRIISREKQ